MGRRLDALLVSTGLKVAEPAEHEPEGVQVTVGGVKVHVVVLRDWAHPSRYVAYGPPSMGWFDDLPVLSYTRLYREHELEVALARGSTGDFRFVSMPTVVERVSRVATA